MLNNDTPLGALRALSGPAADAGLLYEPVKQDVHADPHARGRTSPPADERTAEQDATANVPVQWEAEFVGPDSQSPEVPVLRRYFDLVEAPVSALVHVTFLGVGRLWINGQEVGSDVLAPGWQSYEHRLIYDTYDVTPMLRTGPNTIEAQVADGWYAGRLGFFGQRAIYGSRRAALVQLEMRAADGACSTIATDPSWQWRPGPTLSADLYDGETHDARCEDLNGDQGWRSVQSVPFDLARLVRRLGPPVRRVEVIRPRSILTSPSGKVLVDFGRVLGGWVRIRVQGPRGETITLRHAEVLEHGELGIRPLRSAAATDRYTLRGEGVEEWEPSFTYHGFRYVEVEGWPGGAPGLSDIEAVFVHSDMERIGWFRTSHPELMQLHENVVASMRANFVSIPTDCPQRDERVGWTGDIALFGPTATFLYDCIDFLRNWLIDVASEQAEDGAIPHFVPLVPFPPEATHPQFHSRHLAVWGDVATLLPFALFQSTGDATVLAENFDLMRRWVDGVAATVGPTRIWDTGFQFGDWLDPSAPPEDPAGGATEPSLVATAYFAHSARLLSRAAGILGREDDRLRYERLATDVVQAFQRRFLADDGRATSDTQTAYAIVLCLDLAASQQQSQGASERLVELVRQAGHRISTGFVGTPLILEALTRAGALDDAYSLLLQRECPSWLYAVTMGATSIWERWDSMLPDGGINPGEMTSFNHYALGAVAEWLHSTVAGLRAEEPGYGRIRIAPRPRLPLHDAGATLQTRFGPASVDWQLEGDRLAIQATVPDGVTAVVDIEGTSPFEVGPGCYEWIATAAR